MNLMTFLRKIGVLRYGKKTFRYSSGRDMEPKALMDDVYDPEQDLVTKEDFHALKDKLASREKK